MGIALGWVEANVSNGRRDVIGTGLRSLVGSNPTVSTILGVVMQNEIIEMIFRLLISGKGGFENLTSNEVQIIELLKLLQEEHATVFWYSERSLLAVQAGIKNGESCTLYDVLAETYRVSKKRVDTVSTIYYN